ncbi:ESX secretion-associated protein EspG [Gandjariella thermophila]|uniref:ESX secretion-associated protein EspG n=1 Tax=Gandjariella thermophila TaxID=1931992 RepID=A0A4D4J5Y0_9PSEU|nr:ESX secretion-associated protein EspG [Gandjariella thermophila]GDY32115.1 ESX secretion-associated protein EspG [Gandjariella thermophila]
MILQQTTVSLSATAYQVAWEHLALPAMPIVLYVPAEGTHPEERELVRRSAWAELRALGAAGRRGLEPWFAGALRLLARPRRSIDLRFGIGRNAVRGLTAAGEDDAVLAERAGGTVRLRPVGPGTLAEQIVGLLPPHPPGPGSAVSLPVDDVDAAAHDAGGALLPIADHLRGGGVPAEALRALAAMTEGILRRGRFGAALRDGRGRRRRLARGVAVHDTPAGRYLIAAHRAGDPPRTTVGPADPATLAGHVRALLDEPA